MVEKVTCDQFGGQKQKGEEEEEKGEGGEKINSISHGQLGKTPLQIALTKNVKIVQPYMYIYNFHTHTRQLSVTAIGFLYCKVNKNPRKFAKIEPESKTSRRVFFF